MKDIQATIEIDLNKSNEELWNNLDKDARWGVKKAIKSGLKVESDKNNALAWDKFYEIYKETIIRGGITPKNIQELQQQTGRLFLCLKENTIIAGAAILIKQDKIELFLNASLREHLTFQPNNLLYWKIIEWGKKNNYNIFNLGGYQLNTKKGDKLYEINRFKERWGGEIKKYYIDSKNPFYILGRKIIRNFSPVKKIRDKIKLLIYKIKSSYSSSKKPVSTPQKNTQNISQYKTQEEKTKKVNKVL
ncbi:MAG: peptidoglycan bridge formation glycyltransferase FemA/FemB family protein [Nanoarchaeota archaeon]|nr:peptidoglycan bridge formation glycyltransferase FemA/FemB family protein [Nanoarchaeota archaeon]